MKFFTRVKVVSLLAVFLVMLAGLSVSSAEAGLIKNPELNAFFDPDPKSGANTALNLVGNVTVPRIAGWNQFNKLMEDSEDMTPETIEFLENGLKDLMAITKAKGINKVHFTFFEIVGNGDNDAEKKANIDGINWSTSTYEKSTGEVFAKAFDDSPGFENGFVDDFRDPVIRHNLDQRDPGGTVTGFITFTPVGSFVPNPVTPTNPGVVKVEPTKTGTAVRNEHSALVSVTDSSGHTLPSAVNTSNVDSASIIGLPVFEVTVTDGNHTAFMGYETTLNESAAKGYKVKNLTFLKRRANGAIVEFERIENPANVGNGQFAVTLVSSPETALNGDASIASGTMYLFSFGIQDNGDYDWDSTDGTIVDPAAIAASQTQTGGGGGGCNAGFGMVGLLFAGLAVLKYRKD